MASLGIRHVYQGQRDKGAAYEQLKQDLGLTDEQIAFVGDDIVDLPVMRHVGLAIAVQDAHPVVKQHAHWQTAAPGGRGAARDVCELLMEAQGTLATSMARYLE
jgi:3-deoxy-D-manno-octulosonate 8-phosphate phosphatase (KDO 8-P phosphatase)